MTLHLSLIDASETLIEKVLGAAIAVHGAYSPGLLESVYVRALAIERAAHGIKAEVQAPVNVSYRGKDLGIGFRADLIVEKQLLLELKSVDSITEVHIAQVDDLRKTLED
jgi:GxxExxY protein